MDFVFYVTYKRLIREISSLCDVFLVSQMSQAPDYVTKSLLLPPQLKKSYFSINVFGFLWFARHFKYTIIASHEARLFRYIRALIDRMFDGYVERHVTKFFIDNDIKLIHAFPFYPELSPVTEARNLRVPLVTEFWEDPITMWYSNYRSMGISVDVADKEKVRISRWLETATSASDHVIVQSNVLKHLLIKQGIAKDKISVIPNCVPPFIPRDPKKIRSLHNISHKRIIFYMGSMANWHDLETLLMSMKMLNEEVVLIIAGGKKKTLLKFKHYLRELGKRVIYAGVIPEQLVDHYVSAADVCLVPYNLSYPSGFCPGAVVRYMVAGKPIVATDLPEIRDLFKGVKAGILVKPNDPKAIADAITILLDNDDEREKMSNMARQIGESNYLLQHRASRIVNVFTKLLVCSE